MIFGGFGQQKTNPIKPKQNQSLLTPSTAGGLKTNLKKQSQFAGMKNGLNPYLKEDYDENPAAGNDENKANC